MTRTTAREIAVHLSFETIINPMKTEELLDSFFDEDYFATLADEDKLYEEYPDEKQLQYIRRLASGVAEHSAELDGYIAKYAKNWRFERISRVAVAIMRVAMFEILYMPEIPYKAAVNEAINLSRGYDDNEVALFINGVLGSFIRGELGEDKI